MGSGREGYEKLFFLLVGPFTYRCSTVAEDIHKLFLDEQRLEEENL